VYRSGQQYGVNAVIEILRGEQSDRSRQRGHDQLSTWGIGRELDKTTWRSVFRQLVARGLLRVTPDNFGSLYLSESCRALLKGEETIELRRDVRPAKRFTKSSSSKRPEFNLTHADQGLWEALRNCRRDIADEKDVPPYVIFHDSTLLEMVSLKPTSAIQLRRINGIGDRKLEAYGPAFLKVISDHLAEA
jgi:ATP-dependent DNA helicase RecQ